MLGVNCWHNYWHSKKPHQVAGWITLKRARRHLHGGGAVVGPAPKMAGQCRIHPHGGGAVVKLERRPNAVQVGGIIQVQAE
jgi:hypothetical protein